MSLVSKWAGKPARTARTMSRRPRSFLALQRAVAEALEGRTYLSAPYLADGLHYGQYAQEGTPLDLNLSFGDDDGDSISATIDWGDGTPTQSYNDIGDGWGEVSVSHTYADAGPSTTFPMSILMNDGGEYDYYNYDLPCINIAPFATLTRQVAEDGQTITASLTNRHDPSTADATSLHYSFAADSDPLATTYAAATDPSSKTFDFDDGQVHTIHAAIFDKDGGFRQYNTSVVQPDLAVVTASSSQVDLSWQDNINAETGWRIQRSPHGANTWTYYPDLEIQSGNPGSPHLITFPATGLQEGTTYDFRVRAMGAAGSTNETIYSPKRWATTILPAPSDVRATVTNTSGAIKLTWKSQSKGQTGFIISRYIIDPEDTDQPFSPSPGEEDAVVNVAGTIRGYVFTDTDPETTYVFTVEAVRAPDASSTEEGMTPFITGDGVHSTPTASDPTQRVPDATSTIREGVHYLDPLPGAKWSPLVGAPAEHVGPYTGGETVTVTFDNLPRHTYVQVLVEATVWAYSPEDASNLTVTADGGAPLPTRVDRDVNIYPSTFWSAGIDPISSGEIAFKHEKGSITLSLQMTGLEPGVQWSPTRVMVETYISFVSISGGGAFYENDHQPSYFSVNRTGEGDVLKDPLTVGISYDGTAIHGADYDAPFSVTIPAFESSVDVPVVPIDDPQQEWAETVTAHVAESREYLVVPPGQATKTILDDEPATGNAPDGPTPPYPPSGPYGGPNGGGGSGEGGGGEGGGGGEEGGGGGGGEEGGGEEGGGGGGSGGGEGNSGGYPLPPGPDPNYPDPSDPNSDPDLGPDPDLKNQVNIIIGGRGGGWSGGDMPYASTIETFGTSEEPGVPPTDESFFMRVNDGLGEGNKDSAGRPVPDNRPDATHGDRVDADGVPIRLVLWSDTYHDGDGDGFDDDPGTLKLEFPDTVKVWRPNPDGATPSDDRWWLPLESGEQIALQELVSVYGQRYWWWGGQGFFVEGLHPSSALHDVAVKATFSKSGAGDAQDTARFTFVQDDIDIDSDNDNGFDPPARSEDEDNIEEVWADETYPGKIIAVNDGDTDGDGIPDFADGYDLDGSSNDTLTQLDDKTEGEQFVPVTIELPEPINLSDALVQFWYSGSDPMGVIRQTDPETGVTTYRPPAFNVGKMRLWAEPGEQPRDGHGIEAGGDYVTPFWTYDWSEVGGSDREATLWVEAIRPSEAIADPSIAFAVDPDGDGPAPWVTWDRVRATVAPRVGIEASTLQAFETPTLPGEFTVYRQGLHDSAITVKYEVAGTAIAGLDYESLDGTVVIPGGQDSATIAIEPFIDGVEDEFESVDVTVKSVRVGTDDGRPFLPLGAPPAQSAPPAKGLGSKAANVIIADHQGVVNPADVEGIVYPEIWFVESGSYATGFVTRAYQEFGGKAYQVSERLFTTVAELDATVAEQAAVGRVMDQERYNEAVSILQQGEFVRFQIASTVDDPDAMAVRVNERNSVGAPGRWESLIPFWGNARAAVHDFQTRNWAWGIINSGLAIGDIFLLKSLAGVGVRALFREPLTAAQIAAREAMIEQVASNLSRMNAAEMAIAESAEAAAEITNDAYRAAYKADKWAEYQLRTARGETANWNYERWSNVFDANQTRALRANQAAAAYRQSVGWVDGQFTEDVEGVARRYDMGDKLAKKGIEYKTGYQTVTTTGPNGVGGNLWEIARDEIMKRDKGWDIRWIFEGDASQPLLDALDEAAIPAYDSAGRALNAAAGL